MPDVDDRSRSIAGSIELAFSDFDNSDLGTTKLPQPFQISTTQRTQRTRLRDEPEQTSDQGGDELVDPQRD